MISNNISVAAISSLPQRVEQDNDGLDTRQLHIRDRRKIAPKVQDILSSFCVRVHAPVRVELFDRVRSLDLEDSDEKLEFYHSV